MILLQEQLLLPIQVDSIVSFPSDSDFGLENTERRIRHCKKTFENRP
jgi:hypothetical protein